MISLGIVPVQATELNLLAGGSGTINGAFFTTTADQSTGTGVIDSFVRVQADTTEQGYNAGARPVMPDVNTSPTFTRDIQLSAIPTVVNPTGAAPGTYYQFLLDINQTNASPNLTLNSLQIYTKSTPLANAATLTDLTSNAALKYNMDAGTDSRVQLNYSLNAGSGSGDLFVYVPIGNFAGVSGSSFVYLYSMFGIDVNGSGTYFASNDGFEEWAVLRAGTPSVPDGGTTIALFGFSLLCVEALRRKLRFS